MTPSIANLRNVAALIELIEKVQGFGFREAGMATFHGPSGWGKTTAVTVAANMFNAHCVMIKSCWHKKHFLRAILREIGLPPKGDNPTMVDEIGAHLARSDRPLIIDDAQYLLRYNMIELARDIFESSHVPVILVGEEELPQKLTKWENIHNRQLAWGRALPCNMSDAKKLAPIYTTGVDVADDLLSAIVDASGGSIRRVRNNLATVRGIAKGRGRRDVDLALWGNRDFDTGQPPLVRRVEDFRPVTRAERADTVVPLAPEAKEVRT
jgi:DNA transposition AAA+ family ATPase